MVSFVHAFRFGHLGFRGIIAACELKANLRCDRGIAFYANFGCLFAFGDATSTSLCIAKQSDDDLKALFKFELSPSPISLFTGESMHKGTKFSFYTSFTPITEDIKPEGYQYVVIDSGHLLHKVVWRRQATFGAIAGSYV
ncbi:hypothetical protein AVEN_256925-1 [Araneus ventricosus]|uniref:Uncharacterized protein n=1 Tax=Araneus ventricosus TaxID=182803 RepID=A0A4Y2CHM0_ARAVE|nr:hypothetical protein AVEN_256925-1 [Araneus ventricosus]